MLVVSDGWRLFGEKESLIENRTRRVGGVTTPFGRIGRGDRPPAPVSGVSQVECEADLRALARMDHTQRLRGLADAANGALVTFVPVTGEALGATADAPSLGSGLVPTAGGPPLRVSMTRRWTVSGSSPTTPAESR